MAVWCINCLTHAEELIHCHYCNRHLCEQCAVDAIYYCCESCGWQQIRNEIESIIISAFPHLRENISVICNFVASEYSIHEIYTVPVTALTMILFYLEEGNKYALNTVRYDTKRNSKAEQKDHAIGKITW